MEHIKNWHIILFILAGVIMGALFMLGFIWPSIRPQQQLPQRESIQLKENLKFETEKALKTVVPDIQSIVIVTPKSAVNKQYHDSLNALVKSAEFIRAINVTLVPLLEEINRKNVSGEYAGIVDLVIQARDLNNEQKKTLNDFKNQLEQLRSANQATSDNAIQTATAIFLNAGDQLSEALAAYITILERLLGGEAPSEKISRDLTTSLEAIRNSSGDFSKALENLLSKLAEKITPPSK